MAMSNLIEPLTICVNVWEHLYGWYWFALPKADELQLIDPASIDGFTMETLQAPVFCNLQA
jgi:hypothetical protein